MGFGIALDAAGSAYVTGFTGSIDFPTIAGAFDTRNEFTLVDGFVTKLELAGTPATPATLTLEPKTDTNTVGTAHTVTATVKDAGGNPVPGVTVRFSATGANSTSGAQTTDANGQASFTHTGFNAGTDTISAFADTNDNTVQDSGEPSDTARRSGRQGRRRR